MKMIHEDLHPKKPVSHVDLDSDGETNVLLDDVAHVVEQFKHKNKGNVNIPRMTTDDPMAKQTEVKDPNDEQVESKFQAKQDVSYLFFNPDTPWNECKPVLGMRNPKIVDDDECDPSKHDSKKGDGRQARNETLSKAVKEKWNKKKDNKKKGYLNKNWSWFLSLIRDDLNLGDERGMSIMSDGNKGLLQAVVDWLPNVEHKQCAMHIYANIKKRWNGLQFKRLFWGAAATSIESIFLQKIEEIKMLNEKAHEWLVERNPISWCRAYFEMDRCSKSFKNGGPIKQHATSHFYTIYFKHYATTSYTIFLNTMPPPPTPSPSTSNIMPPPYGSNTMLPPPTPSGSKTMPSHATLGSNTSAGSNTMPSASTGTNKGKGCETNRGGSRGGSKGGARGGASKRGRGSSKIGRGSNTIPFQDLRDEASDEAQDKGMPEDVAAGKQPMTEDVAVGKQPMTEDVAAGKQPMIKDEPLQGGADLPTQESTVEVNLKPTRSKKSTTDEVPNKMRIFHKNKGRSERIFNQKMKNYKFDEHGTRSTLDKAFDVE
uniref:Uncharacterized protein n=1 Tax=Tanacetum cinerariifolium TaxID=118510 RepID=A0A6L2K2K5_TANCI|nr:hypothetical protein CTI12_AA159120 [Tanacetum cinerariifolium]